MRFRLTLGWAWFWLAVLVAIVAAHMFRYEHIRLTMPSAQDYNYVLGAARGMISRDSAHAHEGAAALAERLLDEQRAGSVEIVWDRWLHRTCAARPTVTECWGVRLERKVYR